MGTIKLAFIGILLAGLLFGFAMPVLADDPPQLTTIEVTPINPSINVGQSLEFTASGKDQNGNPFPLSDPQWQGDSWHGTISVNPTDPNKCTFTATATGDSYIMCWEGPPRQGIHGSTDITITQGSGQQLDSIVVSPANVNLEVGGQQLFSAVGYDTNGDPMDPPITPMWSTDGGTVAQDGQYTAPDTAGDYTVTASVTGSVTGSTMACTASVHVTPRPVQAWVDEKGVLQIKLQGNANVKVGVDENGNVLINGQPMGDPPVKAGDIKGINVEGGTGDNEIDLSGVTCEKFGISVYTPPYSVQINGGSGDDTITGSGLGNKIDGGDGDDTINGGGWPDNIKGGSGSDRIDGGFGDDRIDGGVGNDIIDGGGNDDFIYGGAGDDRVNGGDGCDIIEGGAGADNIHGGDDFDMIYGGEGTDTIFGEGGNDIISGGDGTDIIDGGLGEDDIGGGLGNDVINGGGGHDDIDGGVGHDIINGGDGDDIVEDWWGNDTIVNRPGSDDIIIDHDGNDTLDFSPATSGITIDMDMTDVDQVVDAAGNTVRLEGRFENFIGSEFDDVVFVGPLDVPRSIDGGDGTDTLNFDAKGVSVTDDGTTITAEGFAPVTYANFEAVNITNTLGLGTPVETATGTAYFATDAGTLENLAAVAESTLPEEGKPALVFLHGFFSFKITSLTPCTHQKVAVTITLPSAVPVGTQYWKYHASEGGWIQIPMGSDDGDAVITITLEDGGLGDDDGECNGVIVDSGGPGVGVFDTGSPANPYPSISGTHRGTITANQTITVSRLYTYPCAGTGGHSEYARIWNTTLNVTARWDGYRGDWHNISFDKTFTLAANETYNYTIKTGSYPQIIHEQTFTNEYGTITCTEFTGANGKIYHDWIPAIRLYGVGD